MGWLGIIAFLALLLFVCIGVGAVAWEALRQLMRWFRNL